MAMNKALPRSRYLAAVNGNGSSGGNGLKGNGGLNGNSSTATNRHTTNGHGSNGNAIAKNPVDADARAMTSLILSLTRKLFAVDDRAADLPLRQLRVCMLLHEGARTMSALSRELGVSLSAMTQIADRLEKAGIVKRSFEGSDRRVRCLQLTTRGKNMMREREQTRIQRVSAVVETMSEKSRKDVLSAFQVLLDASRDRDEAEESESK
jgi:DNA-binding MarR family transcriptional regulator